MTDKNSEVLFHGAMRFGEAKIYSFLDASKNATEDKINRIEESKQDLMLMDIEMPGMSGIEAVKILKEKHPIVKILMETIFEDNDKIFQSVCNGAEGYSKKHFSGSSSFFNKRNLRRRCAHDTQHNKQGFKKQPSFYSKNNNF